MTQSFAQTRADYAAGKLSPVDVAREALERAERADARLNCFALLDPARAMDAALRSEQRWRRGEPLSPLDGMPIAIKEFAAVEGWPTRYASRLTSSEPAAASTPFVARLIAAGAVPIGKTRAPEFNWKGVTDSPGFGVTRNPWGMSLTPGGSSGGCAAAVAAGVVRISIGSDAGGSVRIPAAFTGTLGLKPSFGRIPMSPNPSHFSQTVHVGPLAASVEDMADALGVMAGASAADWTSLDDPDFARGLAQPHAGKNLRIGVLDAARWQDCEDAVAAAMQAMQATLAQGGFALSNVDFDVRGASDVAAHFYRIGCAQILKATPEKDHGALDPGLIPFVRPVMDLSLDAYIGLMRQRDAYGAQLARLFESIDVLVLPVTPVTAFAAGRNAPENWSSDDWMSWNPFTPAFNLTHAPALSYPVWPQGAALPVGVQLVAAKNRDAVLVDLARWLEHRLEIRLCPA